MAVGKKNVSIVGLLEAKSNELVNLADAKREQAAALTDQISQVKSDETSALKQQSAVAEALAVLNKAGVTV